MPARVILFVLNCLVHILAFGGLKMNAEFYTLRRAVHLCLSAQRCWRAGPYLSTSVVNSRNVTLFPSVSSAFLFWSHWIRLTSGTSRGRTGHLQGPSKSSVWESPQLLSCQHYCCLLVGIYAGVVYSCPAIAAEQQVMLFSMLQK